MHPNYGSNKLVSTGRLASGKLRPTEEYAKADLDVIRRCCSEGFNYVQCEGYIHHAALGRLHALLDLCFVKGANPSNVFSVKAPKPMGDGKNKRTAYYFKNARTTAEAIKLTYQFFKKSGIGIIGQKEIGGMDDQYIYDVHSTTYGKVWVRIPKSVEDDPMSNIISPVTRNLKPAWWHGLRDK